MNYVALLAEGVDRNTASDEWANADIVALLAEGVDRNGVFERIRQGLGGRPPRGGRG